MYRHTIPALAYSYCTTVLACTQVDKFLPRYQRKKVLEEQRPPPVVFEVIPSSGTLQPGERVNVQIKFSPIEGVNSFFELKIWQNSCYCVNIIVKMCKAVWEI